MTRPDLNPSTRLRDPFAGDVLERLARSNLDYQREHGHYIVPLAERLLRTRAELEQAERERDEARQRIMRLASIMGVPDGGQYVNDWKQRAENVARAETRLAKVPALVEALRRVQQNAEDWHGPPQDRGQDRALTVIAEWCREALTVWEQE